MPVSHSARRSVAAGRLWRVWCTSPLGTAGVAVVRSGSSGVERSGWRETGGSAVLLTGAVIATEGAVAADRGSSEGVRSLAPSGAKVCSATSQARRASENLTVRATCGARRRSSATPRRARLSMPSAGGVSSGETYGSQGGRRGTAGAAPLGALARSRAGSGSPRDTGADASECAANGDSIGASTAATGLLGMAEPGKANARATARSRRQA